MPEAETSTDAVDSNLWETFLAAAATGSKLGTGGDASNLIVLGDRLNGKSSVLDKFMGRVNSGKSAPGYIMDYSYINVTNKFNLDKQETVSRMSVWQLDDENHLDLLAACVGTKDTTKSTIVVSLDLSKPWDLADNLEKWLKSAARLAEKLHSDMSEEDRAKCKLKISKYVQSYRDYSAPNEGTEGAQNEESGNNEKQANQTDNAQNNDGEGESNERLEDEMTETMIDAAVPSINLGIPLIIVGNKADYFDRVLSKTGADKKFEFVCKRLRKMALEYGASLVFTSAVGEGINIELLQDYVNHRTFGFPYQYAARAIGNYDDFGINIPSGYDSLALIEATGVGSSWNDATDFDEVFEVPAAIAAKKRGITDMRTSRVAAIDDDVFFRRIANSMDGGVSMPTSEDRVEEGMPDYMSRGRARSSTFRGKPPPPPATSGQTTISEEPVEEVGGEKKKKKVKNFFKNLLNK